MRAELYRLYDDFESVVQILVETEEGKADRVVEFKKIEGDVEIRCWDKDSLVLCDGNRYGLLCSHSYAAFELVMSLHGAKRKKKQLVESLNDSKPKENEDV